jgi:hypothetical protein
MREASSRVYRARLIHGHVSGLVSSLSKPHCKYHYLGDFGDVSSAKEAADGWWKRGARVRGRGQFRMWDVETNSSFRESPSFVFHRFM